CLPLHDPDGGLFPFQFNEHLLDLPLDFLGLPEGSSGSGQQRQTGDRGNQNFHAITSLIGLASFSVMRIGRPTLERFSRAGLRPKARTRVARRSCVVTGRSSIVIPSALVLPTAWPPLRPPPARTVVQALGK